MKPKNLNEAIWSGMTSVCTVFPQGGATLAKAIEEHVSAHIHEQLETASKVLEGLGGSAPGEAVLYELKLRLGQGKKDA